jgi:hypothetical protein
MSLMGQGATSRFVRAKSALASTPDIGESDCHVSVVPILLQKDFAHLGEQHSLKVGRACATLIQRSIRPGSIVARFYFTDSPR